MEVGRAFDRGLAGVPFRSFALVMATGIVAEGAAAEGHRSLSRALLWTAAAALAALVVLTAARAVRVPDLVGAEVVAPASAVDSLAVVAATAAVGSGLALQGHPAPALALLGAAAVAWLAFGALAARSLRWAGAGALVDARGRWILGAVSTLSLAKLAAVLSATHAPAALLWAGAALTVLGVGLYAGAVAAIAARLRRRPLRPEHVEPDVWIVMGGLAIATLAGARILQAPGSAAELGAVRDVVMAAAVVVWVLATAAVPPVLAAEAWRWRALGRPRYTVGRWSMVFPVGMLAVAAIVLGRAEDLEPLRVIGGAVFWVALALWVLTALGLARSAGPRLRRSPPAPR